MQYRPEIDGLRAVAVLPVVLFHAGVAGFSGGFVGVDVFFVISGYLITTKILEDLKEGKFSLLDFYEKRVRRILPLMILVILASTLIFYPILSPSGYVEYTKSAFAALKLMSDVFFRKTGDYFANSEIPRPLLHTWSLSIEEKYYLLFPLLVIAALRMRFRAEILVPFLAIITFFISVYYSFSRPSHAYYMFLARIWEILGGATIAIYAPVLKTFPIKSWKAGLIGWSSLILLAVLITTFSEKVTYPGFASAIPVFATSAIILSTGVRNSLTVFLSARPLVFLGLISYSVYMWHQPVLVAVNEVVPSPDWHVYLLSFALILILSFLSWRFIELPARLKSWVSLRTFTAISMTTLGLAFFALISLGTASQNRVTSITPSRTFDASLNDTCFLVSPSVEHFDSEKCQFHNQEKYKILVIGDSHSTAIFSRLTEIQQDANFQVVMMSSSYCLPLVQTFPSNESETATPRCASINKQVGHSIASLKPDIVLLSAYMFQWSAGAGSITPDDRWTYNGYYSDFLKALRELSSTSKVVVVGTLPIWRKWLPDLVAQRLGPFQSDLNEIERFNQEGLANGLFEFDQAYGNDVTQAGAKYVSVLSKICKSKACPWIAVTPKGKIELTSFDYGHLSDAGAAKVVNEAIIPVIQGILQSH